MGGFILSLVCVAGVQTCSLSITMASSITTFPDGSPMVFASIETCGRYADRWNSMNMLFSQGMTVKCVPKN